ncbi:hypothetical protein EH31_13805 [Erythrobacter longus]|uniref:histidine kinase n=1 Tax=Erythrobacter longus TaxID=1044 RepID=A0A074MU44_ERYLO|nr:HAMP domain-containing sensor histidine kinase [Erythrobacter longus]KEO89107.1 hypothetical protein EH31_13805 [Erythrobacter longus]
MTKRLVPGSLRLRFLLAITIWVALGIGAIWFSAVGIFSAHVEQSYHEELEVHVRELARLAELNEAGEIRLSRPLSDPRYDVPFSGFYWQISADGLEPLRSRSMTRGSLDERIAHSPEILHTLDNGPTGPAITYGLVEESPSGQVIHYVIATDQSELDRLIDGFTRDLTLWLAVLGSLLLATGLAIIGFGLHPLDRLSRAIARLRQGKAEKLEGDYPAEIAPLVRDLNAYIHQNADMIARARVQAGNLAHSLRTPLAIITDEAERLANNPECSQAAEVLLEQGKAMEQQIAYQLARARSSSGQPYAARPTRTPDVAVPIVRAMERLHPTKRFTVNATGCHRRIIPVDSVDYAELLSILLDNAGKWAHHEVQLHFECEASGPFIARICDDGPGIDTEKIGEAFLLGSRLDTSKPGAGLGLAIARDIAEAIGVELRLENAATGLIATVVYSPSDCSGSS